MSHHPPAAHTSAETSPEHAWPPAAEPEVIVARLRRHGRRLLLPIVLLFALAAAGGYFVGSFAESWQNLAAAGGGALFAVLLGIAPILSWLSTRSIVTTRRIIVRRGLLVHHRWEVSLSRVREVRMRRGPIQRIFGSGDVLLLTTGEAPLTLRDVPAPGVVVDALHELIERGYRSEVGTGAVPGAHYPGATPFAR